MTGRVTRLLAGLLGAAARVLPPARRQWAEAVLAEAGQVPAGWRRAGWLAGGVWLVAREAGMARRIVHWLGPGAVAAAAAWAVWVSWRAGGAADPESVTDRVRVLAGVSALVVLPWAGRRGGVLGPAGGGLAPRLVRAAGCAAVCGAGASLVRWDGSAGRGGVLGSGAISWPRETAGLALLAAAAAVPPVIRALAPRADAVAAWGPAAAAAVAAFAFVPLQALTVAYVAGILAATSRRSPLPGAALAAGALAGVAACLVMYAMVAARPASGLGGGPGGVILFFTLSVIAFLVPAAAAGIAAARLLPGLPGPQEPPSRRSRQAALAGVTAGAAGGLLITTLFAGLGLMMILGPLAGAAGGALGGAIAARPAKPLPDGSGTAGMRVPAP